MKALFTGISFHGFAFENIDWQKANEYFAGQRDKAAKYLDDVLQKIEKSK